jgi:AcrR family transcriptional regulator
MREPSPEKQEAILNTALRLFTERGFAGTPTSLISKEAGVATGTLFFYFKTKEDLIDTLYRRVKSEAAETMGQGLGAEKTAKAKFRRLGKNAVGWGLKNPAQVKFMEQFAHSPFVSTSAHEEGMSHFAFLEDLIRQGIADGEIRDSDPSGLLCMMASALSGLIAHALSTDDPAERAKIIGDGLDFIWYGMKA